MTPILSLDLLRSACIAWMIISGLWLDSRPAWGQVQGARLPRPDDVVWPTCEAVLNVKSPPYNAQGDGTSDDSQAIQRAIDDLMGQHRILYFPAGEYLVSRTIRWSKKHSSGKEAWGHNWIQGQNASNTKIKLKDGVFTDSKNPQSIMWCGGFGSADWFHNYIEDITLDIGAKNPGGIALQFYANNYGAVRNCRFVDSTSHAAVGLDLGYADMNGPLLVKNCQIDGFRIGIKTGHSVNSQTFESISLHNQSEAGFVNEGQAISIRQLVSRSQLPAIKSYGTFALIEANLTGLPGAEAHPAVLNYNSGRLYVRDLSTSGYQRAVVNLKTPDQSAAYRLQRDEQLDSMGPNIKEFSSQASLSLFGKATESLRLPVADPPEVPQAPASRWANVIEYGADPTGARDSTAAIQRAVDSGASTIFLPGSFRLSSTIELRGNVSRVIGTGGEVDYDEQASPDFRIMDGTSPVVLIEHLSSVNGGIEVNTARTIYLKSLGALAIQFSDKAQQGKLFMEDVTTNHLELHKQKVWARQLNVENEGLHISNRAGDLWILGYKTERGGTLLSTSDNGRSEILGGFSYTTTAGELAPMFQTFDSSVFAFFAEVCYSGNPFKTIVKESQRGVEKVVQRGQGEALPYIASP